MKPVMQTICDFEHGDCMRACIASIFELPIDAVPNFQEDVPDHFDEKLIKWCDKFGLFPLDVICKNIDDYTFMLKDCYVVACGESPRSIDHEKHNHAVVWLNGKMVHDPHPDQAGIVGLPKSVTIFIVKNPAIHTDIRWTREEV